MLFTSCLKDVVRPTATLLVLQMDICLADNTGTSTLGLVIHLPACFTYTFLINILPALRVLRRRIGGRVRRDDGPWIIDALEHVDRNHVPAVREVRVAVERNNISLVLI